MSSSIDHTTCVVCMIGSFPAMDDMTTYYFSHADLVSNTGVTTSLMETGRYTGPVITRVITCSPDCHKRLMEVLIADLRGPRDTGRIVLPPLSSNG